MGIETALDKDLRDDMLKLVRYKILFVKREYEHAFPEAEDLVADNMDGSAFTAWKVAEFIQNLQQKKTQVPRKWSDKVYPGAGFESSGVLTGLPENDKKYLRVYYEVLDRYPREKFKYEEQQIRVLEQIRDRLSGRSSGPAGSSGSTAPGASLAPPAPSTSPTSDLLAELPDPYKAYLVNMQLSAPVFKEWRQDFARCADGLSKSLARIFNKYRDLGHITPPEISEEELREALSQSNPPYSSATLQRFTGKTEDNLVLYAPGGQPPTTAAPPGHSWWGEAMEQNGIVFQKITGSNYRHTDPEDSRVIWGDLAQTQVDLICNAYIPELGFVSWSMFRENHDNELRSIGYELKGKLLWINEMLNPDGTKTLGPLPNVVPPQVVTPNQLIISIDYPHTEGDNTYFCVYALHIDIDFEKCSAKFAGRILEMKSQLVS